MSAPLFTLQPESKRPDFVIAGVCEGCGFEGDAPEFEWDPRLPEFHRLKCPRCGGGAWEIPYQSVVHEGQIVTLPNHYPETECDNCGTRTKFGPTKLNGLVHFWCGFCAISVVKYHHRCLRYREPPEFRKFLGILAECRETVAKRRVVIPGA